MIGNQFSLAEKPLLIRNAKPVGFAGVKAPALDILVGTDGKIIETGTTIAVPDDAEILDAGGS